MVQFSKNYISLQGVETPIVIRSRTARAWIRKLGNMYKDVRKNIFVDRHEQPDVIEDCASFLRKIEELKLYIVEFDQDGAMKPKIYLFDCAVG